mgnify:CR=1 FL=1
MILYIKTKLLHSTNQLFNTSNILTLALHRISNAEASSENFVVDEKLIDSLPERDDQCEFERNMYNFGEQENLPDSDRAMDLRCKNN